jgi:predicted DsbA family dithiol-disulfide isomerase
VQLVHFPLHPDTPMEGRSLEELFAGRDYDVDAMYARMKGLMEAESLPYGKRTHTYNSRLAQELGKWADTQDRGYAIHDALYKAYFVEARNIGDVDVLMDVVRAVGLPEDAAREVLEKRTFKDAVDGDWAKSHQYGVTGVPTFAAGGYGVVGAQPYEAIEDLVKNAGAAPREDTQS